MKVLLICITVSLISLLSAEIRKFSDESVIPDRYIIKLKSGIDSRRFVNSRSSRRNDGVLVPLENNIEFVYDTAFNGFSAELDETQLQSLDSMPEVEYIESDQIVTAYDLITQFNSSWGLARTSTRCKLNFNDNYKYIYDSTSGNGSTVYVLDSGVKIYHMDFGDRASYGFNAISGEPDDDLNGHGTHVAGTVAGTEYGIAKLALIVSVKVLNRRNTGSWSGVTAGIDWVARNARPRSVINMSLGGLANNQTIAPEEAISNAIKMGITTVVAAGNEEEPACNFSPARHKEVITVAASDVNDKAASFTNYGECVDIFAPGVQVLSAGIISINASMIGSGTSMAAPHVAGLAAYLMSKFEFVSPAEVKDKILYLSTENAINGVDNETPNKIIYSGLNDTELCYNAATDIKSSTITFILLVISFVKIAKEISANS